jgi:hypothetical protein
MTVIVISQPYDTELSVPSSQGHKASLWTATKPHLFTLYQVLARQMTVHYNCIPLLPVLPQAFCDLLFNLFVNAILSVV